MEAAYKKAIGSYTMSKETLLPMVGSMLGMAAGNATHSSPLFVASLTVGFLHVCLKSMGYDRIERDCGTLRDAHMLEAKHTRTEDCEHPALHDSTADRKALKKLAALRARAEQSAP